MWMWMWVDWLYVFVFAHIIPLASFVVNCRTFNQTHSHTKLTIVSPYRDVSFHMFDVKTLSFVCILLFVECEKFRAVLLRRKGKQKQWKKNSFPSQFHLCHIFDSKFDSRWLSSDFVFNFQMEYWQWQHSSAQQKVSFHPSKRRTSKRSKLVKSKLVNVFCLLFKLQYLRSDQRIALIENNRMV